ncbi:MAG TPA: hypothetical protein VE010_17205, partial [Thermoanaerobaculia bacterium]|nr:hypothetical protein [Thermoanaerobaculia bacterium]
MTNRWIAAGCVALLAACGGNENTSGTPETNTTGTAQSVQQTTPEAATTTGITGGTSSSASHEEKEFVANAGMSGLSEVQLANLALQ